MLFTGLLLLAYSVFASYITQDNLARDGLIHSGLNFPTSIINEENALQACLQASFSGKLFLASCFSDDSSLVKLTKK